MRRHRRAGGRPASSWRPRTTDYRSIDLAWLRRKGARYLGCSGTVHFKSNGERVGSIGYILEAAGLRLQYRVTSGGAPEDISELVPIVTTPMHFGGRRHWFACPSCGRRCRLLYGGARFRCRRCRRAGYESQYQSRLLTITDIRWRLRQRLEERGSKVAGLLGLDDGFPEKPPRMHWRTYRRLEALDRRLGATWGAAARDWLERRDPRWAPREERADEPA
jgi:hypothetical protein